MSQIHPDRMKAITADCIFHGEKREGRKSLYRYEEETQRHQKLG